MDIDSIVAEINNPIFNIEFGLFDDDAFGLLSLGDKVVKIVNEDVIEQMRRKKIALILLLLTMNEGK
jgi:hypothetical protein